MMSDWIAQKFATVYSAIYGRKPNVMSSVVMSPQPKVGDILFLVRFPSASASASASA